MKKIFSLVLLIGFGGVFAGRKKQVPYAIPLEKIVVQGTPVGNNTFNHGGFDALGKEDVLRRLRSLEKRVVKTEKKADNAEGVAYRTEGDLPGHCTVCVCSAIISLAVGVGLPMLVRHISDEYIN